ncbi:MAG: MBL fold metallo-hydrolase [Aquamicrobium sp.]|uniref:MBL fold metallo-hydrolase n=1 Tax=Aquamicrobium sp. TaxID=1872579 RepID=UPI00349ECCD5|nr:MBL fold metallo-hydrolase [Aquamicrobium sp.]
MADRLRLIITGCGSSPGTPRINGDWGACDPENPKNRRRRAAAIVERIATNGGVTRVAIDTGPDFRDQMLDARVTHLDGVVYTHAHADHIHGIDDLRGYFLAQRRRIDVFADEATLTRLREGFGYCFETPPGSAYPPIAEAHEITHRAPFAIDGEGGPITFEPLPQIHGDTITLGFRIGPMAYCPDVSDFPAETAARLTGLDLLVIDALQYRPHPSHFSLAQALGQIADLGPKRAILTHMHIPLDYATVMAETPDHVEPAYDGLIVELPFGEAS